MLRPLGDRIVIKLIEENTTTKSGLVLPDSAKEKPRRGEVIAVGNGKVLDNGTRVAVDIQVGETVLIARYGGDVVEIDGTEYTILSERDILGIVE